MIDQKAREIVASQYPEIRPSYKGRRLTIARLGIIEGLEMAAKVAEEGARGMSYSESPFESGAGFERIKIAAAIRSLK